MSVIDKFDLSGRTALVTGSTRGLGRQFAESLAEAGADIIIHGRDEALLAESAAAVEERGRKAYIVRGDVTSSETVAELVDDALAQAGKIDILINNAGACVHRDALDVTEDEWNHVIDTNLNGLWYMSQAVGRHMVERGSGNIVNVGSISALIVNRPQMQPAYNASKAAVHQLTRSLAAEWAPLGVRVNALAPGYMKTAMSPVDDPKFRRMWIEDAPMQRYAMPEELGGAIVFLASDASSFVTGTILVVDGGYTIF